VELSSILRGKDLQLLLRARSRGPGEDSRLRYRRTATRSALLPHRAATRGLDIYEVINLFVYLESAFVGDPHEHVVRTLQLGETELPC
jgi:hypothetical protein